MARNLKSRRELDGSTRFQEDYVDIKKDGRWGVDDGVGRAVVNLRKVHESNVVIG
jgi:hypothetical protein